MSASEFDTDTHHELSSAPSVKKVVKLIRKRRRDDESSDEDKGSLSIAERAAELREEQKVSQGHVHLHCMLTMRLLHPPNPRLSLLQLRVRTKGLDVEVLNKIGSETNLSRLKVPDAPPDAAAKSILGSGFTGQVGSDVRVEDALEQVGQGV